MIYLVQIRTWTSHNIYNTQTRGIRLCYILVYTVSFLSDKGKISQIEISSKRAQYCLATPIYSILCLKLKNGSLTDFINE